MIIQVQLDGEDEPRRYDVRRANGEVCVRRLPDGEALCIDWRAPEPHVYSLLVEGRSYELHIDEDERDEESLAVHVLGRIVHARAADARRRRVASSTAGPDGTVKLSAPMPGRVVKILAPENTVVNRGDGIIVLEAMKMENELKAPRDGTVTHIAVREGQGVEGGAHLATIE